MIVPKCADMSEVERRRHRWAEMLRRRCFINTWKWLLRQALNYKCNSLSAITPQEEGMEEEGKSNFKL